MERVSNMNRRDFLIASAVTAATVIAPQPGFAQSEKPYGPFKMGLQSYTLRAFEFDKALEWTQKLGVHYWESFPKHVPQTENPEQIRLTIAKLKAAKVRLYSWGVFEFDGDEAKSRKVFEFAKAYGMKVLSANPTSDSFDILDKLVAQYKINIAIHNHGPGSRYDTIEKVQAAIKNHHPGIGACVDTGHYLRSGIDPVDAVNAFGKRVYSVHLKDVKDKTQFTELGLGDMRLVELFRALKKLDYQGITALEYEEHETEPGRYVEMCLAGARDAIGKM